MPIGFSLRSSAGLTEIPSVEAPCSEKQTAEQACSTSACGAFWTGSSTLPRLHQKHKSAAPGSLEASGGSFIKITLLPLRVVTISKRGWNAGLGRIATMDLSWTVST